MLVSSAPQLVSLTQAPTPVPARVGSSGGPDAADSSSSGSGAIAGGVCAGVAFAAVGLAVHLRRRRAASARATMGAPDKTADVENPLSVSTPGAEPMSTSAALHMNPGAPEPDLESIPEPDLESITRLERAATDYSAQQRVLNGGADLISAKIDIEGKGVGTVVDLQKSRGKPTKHIIQFESGTREAILLCKDPRAAKPKGMKFWVLN